MNINKGFKKNNPYTESDVYVWEKNIMNLNFCKV